MIAVDDARLKWLVLSRNISHAIASFNSGWYWTACGTFTPNGHEMKADKRPARICLKCRESLKTLTMRESPIATDQEK